LLGFLQCLFDLLALADVLMRHNHPITLVGLEARRTHFVPLLLFGAVTGIFQVELVAPACDQLPHTPGGLHSSFCQVARCRLDNRQVVPAHSIVGPIQAIVFTEMAPGRIDRDNRPGFIKDGDGGRQ
jgi:hypothetical protein